MRASSSRSRHASERPRPPDATAARSGHQNPRENVSLVAAALPLGRHVAIEVLQEVIDEEVIAAVRHLPVAVAISEDLQSDCAVRQVYRRSLDNPVSRQD